MKTENIIKIEKKKKKDNMNLKLTGAEIFSKNYFIKL